MHHIRGEDVSCETEMILTISPLVHVISAYDYLRYHF